MCAAFLNSVDNRYPKFFCGGDCYTMGIVRRRDEASLVATFTDAQKDDHPFAILPRDNRYPPYREHSFFFSRAVAVTLGKRAYPVVCGYNVHTEKSVLALIDDKLQMLCSMNINFEVMQMREISGSPFFCMMDRYKQIYIFEAEHKMTHERCLVGTKRLVSSSLRPVAKLPASPDCQDIQVSKDWVLYAVNSFYQVYKIDLGLYLPRVDRDVTGPQ